jgi:hypothetical protein
VLAKDVEDSAELLQMFCPGAAVDEDVIKKQVRTGGGMA